MNSSSFIAADVLTAPANEVTEAAEDPQIHHNQMIVTTQHVKLGPVKVTGVLPIKFHGRRRVSPGAADARPRRFTHGAGLRTPRRSRIWARRRRNGRRHPPPRLRACARAPRLGLLSRPQDNACRRRGATGRPVAHDPQLR